MNLHARARLQSPYLPAQVAVAAILVLNLALLAEELIPARWGVLGLEGLLLVSLIITTPFRTDREPVAHRRLEVALIAVLALANGIALLRLARFVVLGGDTSGRTLILSGAIIWMTNVVIFGLCFWDLDRGGPRARATGATRAPDFLFPQTDDPHVGRGWQPEFFDYLYLSFTNSTSLSPTDTMPLTRRAKALMMVEALASFLTLALVVSRAVSILN